MGIPSIVIVGRPNVGKSTLFNALAGRRIAIVEPTSGVTRDRISTVLTRDSMQFELIDTGGIGLTSDELSRDVNDQIRRGIEQASVLMFIVDGSAGVHPQDREIARRLRATAKPILLVANKVESARDRGTADADFLALGLGDPLQISALHRRRTGELRDRLFEMTAEAAEGEALPEMRIAVVGQRNVGKSTFINALAREQRVIVSEIPGTTRDSVDVRFERDGKVFVAIDTAGVRKKQKLDHAIEFFSRVRAEESIRRADVVLLVIDPQGKVGQVDKHLAAYVIEHYKPCVIVVNKWDLAKGVTTEDFAEYLDHRLPALAHAPICFISALKNRGVQRAVELARTLWKQAQTQVTTSQLNRVIEELRTRPQADGMSHRRPKIYYATQISTRPPSFAFFVNEPENFSSAYRRYISTFLRSHLPFAEIPIVVRFRKAMSKDIREREKNS